MIGVHQDRYKGIKRVKGVEEGDISDENIAVFKINMMNCIMNILKVFHPTNEYLYIPNDHDC